MDFHKFFGFVEILKESTQIILKNRKFMALTAIFHLFLYSIFYLLNVFSNVTLVYDLMVKFMQLSSVPPGSPQFSSLLVSIEQDAGFFLGIDFAVILVYLVVVSFTITATTTMSAVSYTGGNSISSLKDLLSRVVRSWTRPIVTYCYLMALSWGFTFIFLWAAVIPPLLLSFSSIVAKATFIVLLIIAAILFIHLYVIWSMGIVVSALEEGCYGIEALGKAGRLVEGKRLHGFIISVLFNLLIGTLSLVFGIATVHPWITIVIGVFFICFVGIATMFFFVAYTVLYIQCKRNHGEEIEVRGSSEYSKIPTILLAHEDIA